MFRTTVLLAAMLSSTPGIAETLLCNRTRSEQWVDVRLQAPTNATWWIALPANDCFDVGADKEHILDEARDLHRRPLIVHMQCFTVRKEATCIVR